MHTQSNAVARSACALGVRSFLRSLISSQVRLRFLGIVEGSIESSIRWNARRTAASAARSQIFSAVFSGSSPSARGSSGGRGGKLTSSKRRMAGDSRSSNDWRITVIRSGPPSRTVRCIATSSASVLILTGRPCLILAAARRPSMNSAVPLYLMKAIDFCTLRSGNGGLTSSGSSKPSSRCGCSGNWLRISSMLPASTCWRVLRPVRGLAGDVFLARATRLGGFPAHRARTQGRPGSARSLGVSVGQPPRSVAARSSGVGCGT